MATLRLDISYDAEVAGLIADVNVTAEPTGTYVAGGNPGYLLTGPATHLGVIAARYAGDGEELREVLGWIEDELGDSDEQVDPEMARTLAGS